MECSLAQINNWQLKAIVTMAIIAFITQISRIIDLIFRRFKLVGPSYYGRAASRISLQIWHVINLAIAGLILSGSDFLSNLFVCSFLGYFLADFLELAQHWNSHPKAFRSFIIKHHTLGIIIAVIWTIARIYWPFPHIEVAGALIWNSSSALSEFPMLHKAFSTRDGSAFTNFKGARKLLWGVFILQRLWRVGIIAGVIATGILETNLAAFMFGISPGIGMDLFDIFYQVKSLKSPATPKKEEPKEPVKVEAVNVCSDLTTDIPTAVALEIAP